MTERTRSLYDWYQRYGFVKGDLVRQGHPAHEAAEKAHAILEKDNLAPDTKSG